jgi:folate-binding protein YgfZ
MWVDVTPGYDAGLMAHLDRHLIAEQVELSNRTSEFAQMHLAGPKAKTVLGDAIGEAVPELAAHQHMERSIGSAKVHIRRHDQLGVPGFDIVCRNACAVAVWDEFVEHGAVPAGMDVFETLRIEEGMPLYGVDIDENRFVQEVGRTDAVSFTKGCFLGQEPIVMARDRAGFLNRYFRGLRFSEIVNVGNLVANDKDAGLITSVANSPRHGAIGLGYVRRGNEEPGTVLRVAGPSIATATVTSLPFIATR